MSSEVAPTSQCQLLHYRLSSGAEARNILHPSTSLLMLNVGKPPQRGNTALQHGDTQVHCSYRRRLDRI